MASYTLKLEPTPTAEDVHAIYHGLLAFNQQHAPADQYQARPFYEKMGYTVSSVLDDLPQG